MENKRKFKNEKLQAIFLHKFYFDIAEINKVIIGDKPNGMGKLAVDRVLNTVSEFTDELEKRGENIVNLEDDLEKIKYALIELRKYFDNEDESYLDDNSAYIFWFFLDRKLDRKNGTLSGFALK